jgi:hypothetical protein
MLLVLLTGKTNSYIDPRLTYAWCAKFNVPVEKLFSKTLREKVPRLFFSVFFSIYCALTIRGFSFPGLPMQVPIGNFDTEARGDDGWWGWMDVFDL